jgi:hypothetical protein
MIKTTGSKGLPQNALVCGLVISKFMMKQLDGDWTLDSDVLGLKDLAHTALPQEASEAIAIVDEVADLHL